MSKCAFTHVLHVESEGLGIFNIVCLCAAAVLGLVGLARMQAGAYAASGKQIQLASCTPEEMENGWYCNADTDGMRIQQYFVCRRCCQRWHAECNA